MKNIINEKNRRKLNRPITGIIQEDRIWEQWYAEEIFSVKLPKENQTNYMFSCNEGYENQVILNNRGKSKFTVQQFKNKVDMFAKAFIGNEIIKGDIICTVGLSTPELVAIKYSCATNGIITANLNFMDAQSQNLDINKMYNQIKTIKPRIIFFLDILEDKVSKILNLPEFSSIQKVRMPLNASNGFDTENLKIALLQLKNSFSNKNVNGAISLNQFLSKGQFIPYVNSVYSEKMPSNIAFTSGTTGQNKAVLLSHDANNALALQHKLANLGLKRGAKHLALVPPFLAFWDADIIHMAMCIGVENILELSLTYENIPVYMKKYLPQYGIWSQYLWDSILQLPKSDRDLISKHLEKVVVGGERCEINQAQTFYNLTGIIQEAGFGATEVNTCFSVANPNCNVVGSAGIPLPFNNVKIVDDSFQDLTYNKAGRLLITGPCLMNGYYGRDDLTKQVLLKDRNGITWYDTKDYAVLDMNGNLHVLDRDSEPITIHNNETEEKVKLLDIVEKIKNHPAIKICKLSNFNEYIVLHLVIDEFYGMDHEEAIESIKESIKNILPEKYWPNAIYVDASLPRTYVGKVDYNQLNENTKMLYLNNGLSDEKLVIIDNVKNIKIKKHI